MTTLVILSANERAKFDQPPKFNENDRTLYFSLTNDDLKHVKELRSPTTKVGFVLQLGYFKSNGKFYLSTQFRAQDMKFVSKMLNLNFEEIDLVSYSNKMLSQHQSKILSLLSWQPYNKLQQAKIDEHVY